MSFCCFQKWDSSSSGIEVSLIEENFVTCNYHKVAAHSRKKSNCDDALFIKSSHSDESHGKKDEELAVIVEDVTDSMPPDVPLASGVVPRVENEVSDEFSSSRGNGALSSSSETEREVNFSCEFQFFVAVYPVHSFLTQ